MLIHTDFETVGLKGMQRQQAQAAPVEQETVAAAPESSPVATSVTGDPELAAYNARLAELAAQGPKTWRHRESAVVRWEQ